MASYENYPDHAPIVEARKNRRKLKTMLAIAVVVLLVAGLAAGIMIWKNGTLGTAHQADTEALNQSTAGVDETTFEAVSVKGLPALDDVYGKTLGQIKKAKSSKLSFFNDKPSTTSSAPDDVSASVAKKIKYVAQASLVDNDGTEASVYFDKNKKAIAIVYDFDLDALGVPEADFAVYAADRTVPASLLKAAGVDKDIVAKAALDITADPSAKTEGNGIRTASFDGKTGSKLKTVKVKKKVYNKKKKKKVTKKVTKKVQVHFMNWNLTQMYEYGTNGSATTRTATVTLS